MNARRLIVGAIFVLLALLAAAVLIVPFLGGWDTFFRVIGVGMTGGAAALLAIPLAMIASRPSLRPGAVTAMVFLGFQALMIGIAIIDIGSSGETFLLAAAWLLTPLLLAVASAFLVTSRSNRAIARIGFVAASVAAVLSLIPLSVWSINGRTWPLPFEWSLVVGQALAPAGLLFLGAAWRRDDERRLDGWVAAALPVGVFIATMLWQPIGAFQGWSRDPVSVEALLLFGWPLAASIAIARSMRIAELRGTQAWLRWGFLGASIAGGALVAFGWEFGRSEPSPLGAACFVIAGCMVTAVIVFGWLNRRADMEEHIGTAEPGTLRCPRCTGSIAIRPGSGACAECGLRYRLSLEAPRCRRCRQNLMHLTSNICPECGDPIRIAALMAVDAKSSSRDAGPQHDSIATLKS